MYYSTVTDMFTIPDAFHHAVQYSTELLYVVIMTMNFSLLHTFSYQKTVTRQPPAAPRRVRPIRHHIFFLYLSWLEGTQVSHMTDVC